MGEEMNRVPPPIKVWRPEKDPLWIRILRAVLEVGNKIANIFYRV